MQIRRHRAIRRGAAAVEMAFMMPLLLGLIVGVWEVGRLVQVQQTMNNAAREGARLASQAQIINTTSAYTNIAMTSVADGGVTPNVTDAVTQYLEGSGFTNVAGLAINFTYLTGDTSLTQPYQGVQNQQFLLTVTMPFSNVKWSPLSLVNPTTIGGSCTWQIMVNQPITVSTTLPNWTPLQ